MKTEVEKKNVSTIDIYDGQFRGNILVLGRTDSGKTYFIQQLALNGILGTIEKTHWVSGVTISDARKAQIQSCFSNEIEFYDINSYEDLNELINYFKEINEDLDEIIDDNNVNDSNNFLGEKKILNNLIVMDDVSGLADNSKSTFADFLTVSRKYRYNVIYAFHNIKTTKEIWSKIISQTTIFNIFPKSTPVTSVFRILQDNCSRKQLKYIPSRNLWIFRLYSDLANSNERHCLTICSDNTNENGPGKYRTMAENPEKQVCYYGDTKNDQLYKVFNSERIREGDFENSVHFKITQVKSKTEVKTLSAKNVLDQYGSGIFGLRTRKRERDAEEEDGRISTKFKSNGRRFTWDSARPKYLLGR